MHYKCSMKTAKYKMIQTTTNRKKVKGSQFSPGSSHTNTIEMQYKYITHTVEIIIFIPDTIMYFNVKLNFKTTACFVFVSFLSRFFLLQIVELMRMLHSLCSLRFADWHSESEQNWSSYLCNSLDIYLSLPATSI